MHLHNIWCNGTAVSPFPDGKVLSVVQSNPPFCGWDFGVILKVGDLTENPCL